MCNATAGSSWKNVVPLDIATRSALWRPYSCDGLKEIFAKIVRSIADEGKMFFCVTKHYAMKTYGGVDV
jgi:hypothetical protein